MKAINEKEEIKMRKNIAGGGTTRGYDAAGLKLRKESENWGVRREAHEIVNQLPDIGSLVVVLQKNSYVFARGKDNPDKITGTYTVAPEHKYQDIPETTLLSTAKIYTVIGYTDGAQNPWAKSNKVILEYKSHNRYFRVFLPTVEVVCGFKKLALYNDIKAYDKKGNKNRYRSLEVCDYSSSVTRKNKK